MDVDLTSLVPEATLQFASGTLCTATHTHTHTYRTHEFQVTTLTSYYTFEDFLTQCDPVQQSVKKNHKSYFSVRTGGAKLIQMAYSVFVGEMSVQKI